MIHSIFSGRDASVDFDDVGHSEEAVKMMEPYYVGELEVSISSSIIILIQIQHKQLN